MVRVECLSLPGFESKHFMTVHHKQLSWDTAWNDILQTGLYQKGPDLSEIGSTWLENLIDMRALRPFSLQEINSLGGEAAFLPNVWVREEPVLSLQGSNENHRRVFSIPWTLDTRLVFFRRDMLAKAGINADGAFTSADDMYDTLMRLQASGIRYPLVMATGGLSIHNMASWVWGRGGHFRSEDYHKIALVESQARQGMQDFFRLHRFIDPETRGQSYNKAEERFFNGEGAVMFTGHWAMKMIKMHEPVVSQVVLDNIGYAPPPGGVPFLGSSQLVIWRHTLHDQEAVQMVAHLTSLPVLADVFEVSGNVPARMDAFNAPPFADDADYQMVGRILQQGRPFRSAHLWGGVEMRINGLLDDLWLDLFANPDLDLESEIARRVGDLARRLEKTLLANW